MKPTLVKVDWCHPDNDWPWFWLLETCNDWLHLQGADYPDGSARHDGDCFWVHRGDIKHVSNLRITSLEPYEQGRNAARSDFGWCSKQARQGVAGYKVACSDYEREGNAEKAAEWLRGYRDYFDRQNAKQRKRQVALPEFYP